MKSFLARRRFGVLTAMVVCGFVAALQAAPLSPGGSDKPKAESAAERTRKALEQNVTIDISEQSLDAALNHLRDLTKLNIVLDRATLQQLGVDAEDVTLRIENGRVRAALRNMLTPYGLGYAVIGDTVLVTTEEMALYRQMRQRVNVQVEKLALSAALRQLARETASNLVLDERLGKQGQTQVSLNVEDVPLEVGVRLLAELAELKPVRIGNVLFVTSKANAVDLRNDPEGSTPPMPASPREEREMPARVPRPAPPPAAPAAAAPAKPAAPADAEKPADKKEEKKEEKKKD